MFLFYLIKKNFRPKGYLVPKHSLKTRRKLYVSPKCSSQDFLRSLKILMTESEEIKWSITTHILTCIQEI
jgi:hypothetical protein